MILFNFIIILFIFFIFYFCSKKYFSKINRNNKAFKSRNLKTLNKKNLNKWMNLTKKERYDLSKQENITYLNNRKVLLSEIRKEYERISKGNAGRNL